MGISISILGLSTYVSNHVYRMLQFGRASPKKTVYRHLTLREIEYLQFIKKKDLVTYGDVLRKLKIQRCDSHGKIRDEDCEEAKTLFGFTGGSQPRSMYHNGQYLSHVPKQGGPH